VGFEEPGGARAVPWSIRQRIFGPVLVASITDALEPAIGAGTNFAAIY
jgi:hypothetical protein